MSTDEQRGFDTRGSSNGVASVLNKIRSFVRQTAGISLGQDKLASIQRRLEGRIETLDLDTLEQYYQQLQDDSDEQQWFLDMVSTNKTNFFREFPHWSFFEQTILPENDTLSIWSAACSTGEEAYTAAMIAEHQTRDDVDYKILGTDINQDVLSEAREARYPARDVEVINEVQPDYVQQYFEQNEGGYEISSSIQSWTHFRRFNLRADRYPYSDCFDVIFCRNVLIYFDLEMIQHVIDRLVGALRPGGYLMIGHTENINGIDHDLQRCQPSIFRKTH